MARPPSELMVFVGFLVFAIISLFFHLPVYQGYNVLNKKMRHILFGLLGALLVICLLAKCEIIGSTLYIVLHCFISIYWGGLAVYKRAKIIKHTQALKQTP
jgi:ABC-type Co2+ transport system permease subunit